MSKKTRGQVFWFSRQKEVERGAWVRDGNIVFLDASGQVVATASHDVPSLAPRQNHAFKLQVRGKRIAGWRYRAS